MSASGIAIYWFREAIMDFILSTWSGIWHAVFGSVGLGFAPVALWLAVFAFALLFKRSLLFRHLHLWLSSIAAVALVFGVMAFFTPIRGSLAPFTLYGEVPLSGRVGAMILGSTDWIGVPRLAGITAVMLAAAMPYFAGDLVVGFGRLVVRGVIWLYVMAILGVRSLWSMYRFNRESSKQKKETALALVDEEAAVREPAYTTVAYAEARQSGYDGISYKPSSVSVVTQSPPAATEAPAMVEPAMDEPETFEPEIIETEYYAGVKSQATAASEPVDYDDSRSDDDYDEDESSDDIIDEDEDFDDEQDDYPLNGTTYEPEIIGKANSLWNAPDDISEDVIDQKEQTGMRPRTVSVLGGRTVEWARPPLHLMKDTVEVGVTKEEMLDTAETIRRTLSEYGVEVEIGQIRPGPTVTMYGLIPGWVRRYKQVKATDENGNPILNENGKPQMTRQESKTRVKVDNILSREKDLALALKTPSIRIETPVMGKSQVGIEVPNPKPSLVTLRSVMESDEFVKLRPKAYLPIALGKGSGGETVTIDLAKMPHLLIAGATGSGKSVCLNTIVSCLILEKTPADLRLLLIDPKRVEMTPYNGIPHLIAPVVVDTDKVVGLLKGVIHEMMNRYRIMEEFGVRNIEAYNKKAEHRMPFMVVVVDELADLMMTASFDVEQSLCRLAQLGRATGIHLIIATQRPSVDVVTGLIKANFPSRISFGVTSQVDSRTILDSAGAEKLLGRGDMLYLPIDGSRPERVQGVFISDGEIENLVDFWQSTPWLPMPRVELRPVNEDGEEEEDDDPVINTKDELFQKAIELAHLHNKLSTSLLQRRLRIGYPRAARLMDELEEKGIVGPSDGSRSRDVIINS
jgi:DNA segregation ATPase FtsK/SpoIIIE-like protein